MSDLRNRLIVMSGRISRHNFSIGDYWNVCEAAADEISRLEAIIETARKLLPPEKWGEILVKSSEGG
jgi:hypothetical protein